MSRFYVVGAAAGDFRPPVCWEGSVGHALPRREDVWVRIGLHATPPLSDVDRIHMAAADILAHHFPGLLVEEETVEAFARGMLSPALNEVLGLSGDDVERWLVAHVYRLASEALSVLGGIAQ